METGKTEGHAIPLRQYEAGGAQSLRIGNEVYGEKGSSRVNIVDILKIQSQCEMLNESGGARNQQGLLN